MWPQPCLDIEVLSIVSGLRDPPDKGLDRCQKSVLDPRRERPAAAVPSRSPKPTVAASQQQADRAGQPDPDEPPPRASAGSDDHSVHLLSKASPASSCNERALMPKYATVRPSPRHVSSVLDRRRSCNGPD